MPEGGKGFSKTTRRVLTRRGVLWLGQTCNLRCHFCYFQNRISSVEHPDHPFMSFAKAKAICSTLREHYGNSAIDIQGGEPTIYPDINRLVAHCREIGLLPTLITNAVVLDKRERCRGLKDSGLRDLLVSVHGLREDYDKAVGLPGGSARQMKALDNLVALGIPFRFNCVLARSVLPHLTEISKLAVSSGARVVNFIAFNPFEDQQKGGRSGDDVPRYADVRGPLVDALDYLEENGVEANVRYLPLCQVPERHRKSFYNFQQLPYDLHEWDYASWSWTGRNPQRRRDGDLEEPVSLQWANSRSKLFGYEGYLEEAVSLEDQYRHSALVRAREHCGYKYAPACEACGLNNICDGFHGDYASLHGADEAETQNIPLVDDPRFYIDRQVKIVEEEDYSWALDSGI